ncbi:NlpC/P60 family protein [Nocardiopsis halophila]|uniref:NlpC/P60 family protein n=1 Tax=Nocardiopsis halophila TaxID=141692 RepID=UPI000347E0E8|nr:NlpC/P60 family protein [Nocardiopsis halophila]
MPNLSQGANGPQREGKLFRVGVYITVHAATEQRLDDEVAHVQSLLASLLLDARPATFRQLQGWISALPLGVDLLDQRRSMDTAALSASFPFASPDLAVEASPTAVLYGLNAASSGVVVWDRWALDSYNSVVLARSGAGKSYFCKLDLLRNLYAGVSAAVVDPEDEYSRLAEAVGGTVIRLGAPGVHLNPLDLALDETAKRDALTRRALFLHTLLAVMLGRPLEPRRRAALDRALVAAYAKAGISTDRRTWNRAVGPNQHLPSDWSTYGADGNSDGTANPHNVYDSALASARELCMSGGESADFNDRDQLSRALFRYNNADWYVDQVLTEIDRFDAVPGIPAADGPTGQGGRTAVEWVLQQLGKPYVYGANGPDAFDCSSLVQGAWAAAGVDIPRVTKKRGSC